MVKHFKNKSPEASDFIRRALTKSIKERASAEDLLNHKWLKMHADQDAHMEGTEQKEVLTNLQTFAKATKF